MKTILNATAVLGIAGALAATAVTPSDARSGRTAAAAAAGFAAGAVVGASAANRYDDRYYRSYYQAPGYRAYAYQPGPYYAAQPAFGGGNCWVSTDKDRDYGYWGSCAEAFENNPNQTPD